MKPVAAIPIHDPDGIMFPHLERITSDLKELFSSVFISVSVQTQANFPENVSCLESDGFFEVLRHREVGPVGEEFLALYGRAAAALDPEQVVHLCFTDRVAYALQSEHQGAFMADIQQVGTADTPLIFDRSELAWQTHPRNYRDIEGIVTTAGEWLFGKSLDFAWCHIVLQAKQLSEIVSTIEVNDHSFGFVAEIVLAIREEAQTKDVDWLAWEDPFISNSNPQTLKQEREASVGETQKRLGYVIPMLQAIVAATQDNIG